MKSLITFNIKNHFYKIEFDSGLIDRLYRFLMGGVRLNGTKATELVRAGTKLGNVWLYLLKRNINMMFDMHQQTGQLPQ